MRAARRMGWWVAVPIGIALGLALAIAIDRVAAPASAQTGASVFTLTVDQVRINQRIAQAGVRRSNRANERLDRLTGAGPGPPGPPGPAGGVDAKRIAYSAAAGGPPRTVLDLEGLSLRVTCEAGGAGETALSISATVDQETSVIGTASVDAGADPANPNPPGTTNFQITLAPGPANTLGGPTAPDGEFARSIGTVLFIASARTISLNIAVVADGTGDRCSFNGTAVPA